jgi:hypothetical protein
LILVNSTEITNDGAIEDNAGRAMDARGDLDQCCHMRGIAQIGRVMRRARAERPDFTGTRRGRSQPAKAVSITSRPGSMRAFAAAKPILPNAPVQICLSAWVVPGLPV